MASQAAMGKKLLAESKYTEAVEQYTLALSASPTSPDYLIQRSTAYQRAKKYDEALNDAEAAVIHATNRAKRELIVQAQLRRGIALLLLERYADAKAILEIVKSKDDKEKTVDVWLSKTEAKLKTMSPEERNKITVKEMPDASVVDDMEETTVQAPAVQRTASPPAEKVRHDWYQNNSTVSISLMAKGVPKDKVNVDITKTSLSISFPIEATGATYDFTLDPLYALVDPSRSSCKVLSTKIEISLAKMVHGKWNALEGSEPLPTEDQSIKPQAPRYPTSSKSGPKNWDKIGEEGYTIGDDDEGDDAMKFFKQLYQGASPETQRAMMKSYSESNGTALSTDWGEVSKKTVETLPPDGMEAKQWAR